VTNELLTVAQTTTDADNTGTVVLVLAVLALLWLGARLSGRRARVCERNGHVPDPSTIGTWGERCVRCGRRL